ncbi:unnamed protein product [Heterobilharzia americana]|nr:unnamed protein product [Heterobilharzia americana]
MVNRSAKKKKEDENKLNEENEARLKAQEQENERIRIEKESKRLREMQEKKELKQRADELKETRTLMNEIKYRLQQLEVEYRNDYAWKRYFLCDGSPNPKRTSMEDVMNDCVQSLKLIDELSKLISELNDNDEDNKARVKYEQTKHELLQQVHSKLDRATVETLSRAVHYADHETLNLQKIWYNDWIVMCIWGIYLKIQGLDTLHSQILMSPLIYQRF